MYNSLQYTHTKTRLIVRHQKRIKYILKKWQNRPITQLIYKLNQEIFIYLKSFLHVPCNISFLSNLRCMSFHYYALNLNFNKTKDNNLQDLYLIPATMNNKAQTTDQQSFLSWMNKKKASTNEIKLWCNLRFYNSRLRQKFYVPLDIENVHSNIYILISKHLCNTLSSLQIQNILDKAKIPSFFIYQLKDAITNKNNLSCFVKSSFFLFVPLWNATFIANTLWRFQYYEKLRHNVSIFWTIVKKSNHLVISRSSILVVLVNDKKYCFNEKSGFYMFIKRFSNIYFQFFNKVDKKNLNIDLKKKKKKIHKKFFFINFWRIAFFQSLTSKVTDLKHQSFFVKIFRETLSSSNSFFRKKDQKQNKLSFSIKISKEFYECRPAIIQKDIRFFLPLFAHLDKPSFLKNNFKNVSFVIKRKKIYSNIRKNSFFALLHDKKKPQSKIPPSKILPLFYVQIVFKKLKIFKNLRSLQSIWQSNIIISLNNFLNVHFSLFLTLLIFMKKNICFMPAWQLNNIEKETYKILTIANLHTFQLIIAMSVRQIQSFFTIQRPLDLILGPSFRSIGLVFSDGITFTNYSNTIPISAIPLINGDIGQKYLNKFIFKALWLWVKKRHNNQSNRWIFHNYWRKNIFYSENNLSKFYLLNYNLQIKKIGFFL